MPFVLENGSAVIRWIFRLASDPEDMISTLGVRLNASLDAGNLSDIYDAFADNMASALSDEYTFRGFTITGKTPAGADFAEELYSNQVGGDAGSPCPQNTAILVQKRTGVPGRANRGRMYLPGFANEAAIEANGHLGSAFQGGLQSAVNDFYTQLCTAGNTNITSGAILHPAGTHTIVTALVVDDVVATQRRRLR